MHSLDVQPIDQFKKEAKRLITEVRAGSATAVARISAVYRDAALFGNDIGLMRAQHVVAVESGFHSWEALVKAPAVELRLVITMSKIPALNDFGIGGFDNDRNLSRAEREEKFAQNRALLRASAAPVALTVEWLRRNVAPTKKMCTSGNSYSFKHTAEREIGYVTNGVFIAAGVVAGYPHQLVDGSPNVRFGFSARSLHNLYERSERPEKVLARTRSLALSVLRGNGVTDVVASTFTPEVVWRERGELRGMKFSAFSLRPPLVSIDLDNFEPLISSRTMRTLGVSSPSRRTFAQVALARRFAQQVVIAYDELERGIAWILGGSSASDRLLEVEPATNDSGRGRQMWSQQARQMWSLLRHD